MIPQRVYVPGQSWAALFVFLGVVGCQLWLVAVAGTDVPFYDQWGIEGSWLYPTWIEGGLDLWSLTQPFNEHRIVWTHVLNLALFVANGQWDPLVQMVTIAFLRGGCAAGLAFVVAPAFGALGRMVLVGVIVVAFLPHLAWHTVLWGIQSHTYFVVGLSLLSLWLLGRRGRRMGETCGGLAAGVAALFAMGPGALVPVALLGLAVVWWVEGRRFDREIWSLIWPAIIVLVLALGLRASVPEHGELSPATGSEFLWAAAQMLGWPHVGQPLAAVVMNLPLGVQLVRRLTRRWTATNGEDFVLLAAGWSVAIALGTAWMRGGSDELAVGVPSRYVDFIVLLPLANVWCTLRLAAELSGRWKRSGILVVGAWCGFLLVGWVGLSAEVMRGLILPRMRDRDAPVRLMQAFQQTGDVAVFAGQPRLYVPHPQPESTLAVMRDPRLEGRLPPSLQPERPMGPLSRGVRVLLGR